MESYDGLATLQEKLPALRCLRPSNNVTLEAVVDPLKIEIPVLKFSLMVEGLPNGISEQDLKGQSASTNIQPTKFYSTKASKIVFSNDTEQVVLPCDNVNSVNQPLLQCIPE